MANNRTLVIEIDPSDDIRRLGDWLTGAGLALETVRPHAGDPLPDSLDGYAALVVMGGAQEAYPGPDGRPAEPWFPALEGLLRKAVRYEVATLAVCLGAQLLASAHGGLVERGEAGPEIGPALVGKRDAAEKDPLWVGVPMAPDVLQWHQDEITELPLGATLLAASTRYPHQAFRLGGRAWGIQFHIECDDAMIANWVANDRPLLDDLGYDPEVVIDACNLIMVDLEEAWQPFAERFAAVAKGELATPPPEPPGRRLPLLGS
ncbi:type 1 glutamine amidotransferase [Rugosimonospora africana]|uniref:Glutamine amidotransferase n=1 Tax=Rugosimonospora africana TaxID=556532 RepID=A0A8J3VUL0_9ACTN|nr:type 1 glutamine amidotransferase [Rugosimonospora africana]GIH18763.1 glutamine amidotransferase [Rugosimonospora africana]